MYQGSHKLIDAREIERGIEDDNGAMAIDFSADIFVVSKVFSLIVMFKKLGRLVWLRSILGFTTSTVY